MNEISAVNIGVSRGRNGISKKRKAGARLRQNMRGLGGGIRHGAMLVQSALGTVETWIGTVNNTWTVGSKGSTTTPVTNDSLVFTNATGSGGLNFEQ